MFKPAAIIIRNVGKMIPTPGMFRKLGQLFLENAKRFPNMEHVLESNPFGKKFDPKAYDFNKINILGDPQYFDKYSEQEEWWGYLMRPAFETWDCTSAFLAFHKLCCEATDLLKNVPDTIIGIVKEKLSSGCTRLWLSFLYEIYPTPKEYFAILSDVSLKSYFACESIADKLENVKYKPIQNSTWTPPEGYIGSITIVIDNKVPRSTLVGWAKQDGVTGEKDPRTQEVYYQASWINKRLKYYKPRTRK